MRNLIGAVAALSLMAVPVAAAAGTRASDVVPAAAKVDRDSPSVDRKKAKNIVGGGAIIAAIAAVGLAIFIVASDDDDDGLSDG